MTPQEDLLAEAQRLIDAGEDASALLARIASSLNEDEASKPPSAANNAESAEDRAKRKETRAKLKATRAELQGMLARIDNELARGNGASVSSSSSSRVARSVVSTRSVARSAVSSSSSSSTRADPRVQQQEQEQEQRQPALELKPPVLDPREILPPHVIEGFRAEFRAKQEAKQKGRGGGGRRVLSTRRVRHPKAWGPTLEDFELSLGTRIAAPRDDKNYKAMLHGKDEHRPFRSYPGAMSTSSDQQVGSPGGKKPIKARAAQSSMSSILGGGSD